VNGKVHSVELEQAQEKKVQLTRSCWRAAAAAVVPHSAHQRACLSVLLLLLLLLLLLFRCREGVFT
jgi:hypothetical protein